MQSGFCLLLLGEGGCGPLTCHIHCPSSIRFASRVARSAPVCWSMLSKLEQLCWLRLERLDLEAQERKDSSDDRLCAAVRHHQRLYSPFCDLPLINHASVCADFSKMLHSKILPTAACLECCCFPTGHQAAFLLSACSSWHFLYLSQNAHSFPGLLRKHSGPSPPFFSACGTHSCFSLLLKHERQHGLLLRFAVLFNREMRFSISASHVT